MMQVTAFRWVPPFAQGLVRDLRVRWALEEAGLPYEVRLIGPDDQKSKAYRKLQPFGQVPVLEDGELHLFESGAIVLHVAERSAGLLPREHAARERARTWVFAAINSIEPFIQNLTQIDLFNADKPWAVERRPVVVDMLRDRLQKLTDWMDGRNYLEDETFTVGDLMMTTVLRILRHVDLLEKEFPQLHAYRKRCEERPSFVKALGDQMKVFSENTPKS
ncbi:MAG: glutathione S-transferase family protein [Polyangiaceae bacterium]